MSTANAYLEDTKTKHRNQLNGLNWSKWSNKLNWFNGLQWSNQLKWLKTHKLAYWSNELKWFVFNNKVILPEKNQTNKTKKLAELAQVVKIS